jgi:membrane protease YdiL (CAAX protease family)
MDESPFMILLYVGVAAYVGHMYWTDLQASQSSSAANSKAMPGATSAAWGLYAIGVIGALLILAVETAGEIALGIADEQSEMVWYLVFASLGAGIVEEVVFRGFLVVEHKGRAALIASCVGFSLLFALIHGHLWSREAGQAFEWTLTTKALFTTGILFANSLWFYALRFAPWNPSRSLFPCMLAHAASNLGVFAVKWKQGFILF